MAGSIVMGRAAGGGRRAAGGGRGVGRILRWRWACVVVGGAQSSRVTDHSEKVGAWELPLCRSTTQLRITVMVQSGALVYFAMSGYALWPQVWRAVYTLLCRTALLGTPWYEALHYAAAVCAYAGAPNEIAWYLALTHAAAGWAWAVALEGTAGYVALLFEAVCWACAGAPGGIALGYPLQRTGPALLHPKGSDCTFLYYTL